MKTKILIAFTFILVLSGCSQNVDDPTPNAVIEPAPEKVALENPGTYADYSDELLESSLAEGKQVVLFYHSKICGSCKLLDRNIKKDEAQIAEDLVILKIDFESSDELREQYNVRTYHTLVFLDAEGNETKRLARNTFNLDKILENL